MRVKSLQRQITYARNMGAYSPVLSGQKSESKDQTFWMKTTEIKQKKRFFFYSALFIPPPRVLQSTNTL